MGTDYDVVVVGAGPAGSSAAIAAVNAGARTLLLDRARFPRYKTCGGGLIGLSLSALPAGFEPPVRERVTTGSFTLRGGPTRTRSDGRGLVSLVSRVELDAELVRYAAAQGVEFRHHTPVQEVADTDGADGADGMVTVRTAGGQVTARAVVAADGSTSRIARQLGVELDQVDLGLEDELRAPPGRRWQGRLHLDWGPMPGSYAWVFPKGESLTVGVITARGEPQETKQYLESFKQRLGLDELEVLHHSGHLTRCRTPGSPLGHGRVLLAGDAAGLLEPWTREGISFALRSGRLAGEHAATSTEPVAAYAHDIETGLGVEMAAGRRAMQAFSAHPGAIHRAVSGTDVGWRAFGRLTRGETTLARAVERLPVRVALAALARG